MRDVLGDKAEQIQVSEADTAYQRIAFAQGCIEITQSAVCAKNHSYGAFEGLELWSGRP